MTKSLSHKGALDARCGSPTPPKPLTEGLLNGLGIGSKAEHSMYVRRVQRKPYTIEA